jgi:outer membrane protein TolC
MKQLFICFLLYTTVSQAQENQKLSLFDCYRFSRESHPYYQDRSRIETNAGLKTKNINTQWLPQLNANAQATYQSDAIKLSIPIGVDPLGNPQFRNINSSRDQYKFWLDINQMIYDGGSISAQRKISESNYQADLMQNESELHKINEQVNQIYFGLLLFKENIALLVNVKENLLQRQKTVDAGVKNGVMQESDLNNITIEVLKNQQQINELKLSYTSGITILSELTGKNLSDSIQIELPLINTADTGSLQRSELKSMDIQKAGLSYSDKLMRSQRLPKLYAFSQTGYGRPGLNMLDDKFATYYMIGLSFKWNLWDWSKTSRERQSISIQSEMIDSRYKTLEKNLRIMLDNSRARIDQLEKSLIADSSIVVLRSNVTRISSVKLEHGTMTITDYINDLNAEIQAKIQMKTHMIQLVQEKVNYLTIKGIL